MAGTSEANIVRNDVMCETCGSALVEDMALRSLASEHVITFTGTSLNSKAMFVYIEIRTLN